MDDITVNRTIVSPDIIWGHRKVDFDNAEIMTGQFAGERVAYRYHYYSCSTEYMSEVRNAARKDIIAKFNELLKAGAFDEALDPREYEDEIG